MQQEYRVRFHQDLARLVDGLADFADLVATMTDDAGRALLRPGLITR